MADFAFIKCRTVSPSRRGESWMTCSATNLRAMMRILAAATCGAMLAISVPGQTAAQQNDNATLPSETPAHFQPVTKDFDYERRDVMILMRDGVKLHTVILIPK